MNPVSRFIHEIPEELVDGIEKTKETMFGRNFESTKEKAPLQKRRAKRMEHAVGAATMDWNPGDKVGHKKWGTGTVVRVQGEGDNLELDVAFPAPTGIKRLLAQYAPITKE